MIRIVIEIPTTAKRKTEKQAVLDFQHWLDKLTFCPLKINRWGVKSFSKVYTAERIKARATN